MKAKISTKLFLFFLTALLLATAVTGGLFCFLITRRTTAIYKADLMHKGQVMARMLSRIYEFSSAPKRNPLFAIRNLNEIAMADVWLIDQNMNVVTMSGHGIPPRTRRDDGEGFFRRFLEQEERIPGPEPRRPEDEGRARDGGERWPERPQGASEEWREQGQGEGRLPPGADEVLKKAFEGQTVVTEVFNPVLETKSLTAATPVYERGGTTVVWALLMHSPVIGLREAIMQSVRILAVCVSCAFLLAIGAAALLSHSFTKPIAEMGVAARELAEGNYGIKIGSREKNELGDLAATLDALAVRLKDASEESARLERMRRDFIANVSHELRTPVTVIRGSLEAIVDGVVSSPEDVAEYQAQMLKETIHLQRLVNDLLELSCLQTDGFKIESEPFDIKEAAQEAAASIQKTAAAKSVRITVERSEGQKIIQGDSGRVRQMFMTILDNAVKFSPEGGLVLMRITDDEISVVDQGPGISAEDLPNIFERFKKDSSDRNKNGSGLGLAIAREIAARHHLLLEAKSPATDDPNRPGAEFTCKMSSETIK